LSRFIQNHGINQPLIPKKMIKSVSQVRVANVKPHAFKSNVNQAELRQTVSKEYGSYSSGNDMQSAFAPQEAFNHSGKTYTSERVCWVNIPIDWDVAKASAHLTRLLAQGKQPCIYQVLSLEPILTSDDRAYMQSLGKTDSENFLTVKKNSQLLINPSTGEIATRSGRTIYRKLFFSDYEREDVDLTGGKMVSAVDTEVKKPLYNGAVAGIQTEKVPEASVAGLDF